MVGPIVPFSRKNSVVAPDPASGVSPPLLGGVPGPIGPIKFPNGPFFFNLFFIGGGMVAIIFIYGFYSAVYRPRPVL